MPLKTLAPVKAFTAWSFSRWDQYTQCPLKAKLNHLDKIVEPGNPAMARGNVVHKVGEAFGSKVVPKQDKRDDALVIAAAPQIAAAAKGKLPAEFATFKTQMAALRKVGPLVEQEWAFDVNWNIVSWFAGNAWLRVKVDVHWPEQRGKLVHIKDYKTGRIYPEKGELQMNLYGVAGLAFYAAAQTVLPALWYLDQPLQANANPAQHEYKRSELPALQRDWAKRVQAMLADRKFAPRPGQHCRWCFYRKSNAANGGGQCKYD